ncbi:MAG: YncE family protein [Candidatus Eremiobacteraeota bacterium]|nr:YncE family protein [Candidatus Eremiobacteraeota bacterium]
MRRQCGSAPALSFSVVAALLAACAGSSLPLAERGVPGAPRAGFGGFARGTGASLLFEAEDTGSNAYLYLAKLPKGPTYTLATAAYAPVGVAFNHSGTTAYAWYGNYYGSFAAELDMIDVSNGKLVRTMPANGCGGSLALTPDETNAVADDSCENAVQLFSLPSLKIRATVGLNGLNNPTGVAIDASGKRAYVAGNGGIAIVDIPRARQTGIVPVPGGSCWNGAITGIALVQKLSWAYAATCDQASEQPLVAVVNTRSQKLVETINVGDAAKEWPLAVAASAAHHYVYVSVENSDGIHGELSAIDTRSDTVTKIERLPWSPNAVAMSPNDNAVFATTWRGTVWYSVGPGGFKGRENGPICCQTALAAFGDFVH